VKIEKAKSTGKLSAKLVSLLKTLSRYMTNYEIFRTIQESSIDNNDLVSIIELAISEGFRSFSDIFPTTYSNAMS
jgi:hypothetical protein